MLGYLFFSLTVLCYVGLALLNLTKPVGNQGMGYGYALLFLGATFAISGLLLTITMLAKGRFDWLAQGSGARIGLALLGWLLITLSVFSCAYFKWSWKSDTVYPQFLHVLASYNGQIWIPLPWLVACWLSLHPAWRLTLPMPLVTYSFWLGLGFSGVVFSGLLIGLALTLVKEVINQRAAYNQQEQERRERSLNQIRTHKLEEGILPLLPFTNPLFHGRDVRQAASAKVKTYPDWEPQLLQLLGDRCSHQEVVEFLSSNDVLHPTQFIQPLQQSIGWVAETVSVRNKESTDPRDWQYNAYGINYLLIALNSDQFAPLDTAFYPHMIQLKQALETTPPERFKDVRQEDATNVKKWLAKHKK